MPQASASFSVSIPNRDFTNFDREIINFLATGKKFQSLIGISQILIFTKGATFDWSEVFQSLIGISQILISSKSMIAVTTQEVSIPNRDFTNFDLSPFRSSEGNLMFQSLIGISQILISS